MKIFNCSFRECKLPKNRKLANVVPIPKSAPVQHINQHLRSVSLTSILSKVAEDFVAEKELKPGILKILDPNHFGVIHGSSTSQALIKMINAGQKLQMDREPRLERYFLIVKRHSTLLMTLAIIASKLESFDISHATIKWITDFLSHWQQRVKLGEDCFSEWGNVPTGVPQGTKLGPWLFRFDGQRP